MDWSGRLHPGEEVRWEGRPAPRCFTFRNWRLSLFGLPLFGASLSWQLSALLPGRDGNSFLLLWLPLPFLLIGAYLLFGHLLQARLAWERTFYVVTDRRILAQSGLWGRRTQELQLQEVTWFSLLPLGEALGTVRVQAGGEELHLSCLEHPKLLTDILEAAINNRPGAPP